MKKVRRSLERKTEGLTDGNSTEYEHREHKDVKQEKND